MALEDFFDHTCTLYHAKKGSSSLGYGITDDNHFSYPDMPAEKDQGIPCHFSVKSGTYQVAQEEPQNKYAARLKLSLPIGTDIRENDKVVSGVTGYAYVAEIPRNVRGHHIIVYVHRSGTVKEAL
jgi:Domain of unknown function (DUF3599).